MTTQDLTTIASAAALTAAGACLVGALIYTGLTHISHNCDAGTVRVKPHAQQGR